MSSLLVEVVRIGEITKHPNADTLSLYTGPYDDSAVRAMVAGKSMLAPNQMREGIVVKTIDPTAHDLRVGRKILKLVSREYQLRKGGTEYQ